MHCRTEVLANQSAVDQRLQKGVLGMRLPRLTISVIALVVALVSSSLILAQATANHKPPTLSQKQIADAIFKENKPFNPDTYTGGMNMISTVGGNTGTFSLYIKDGSDYKLYAQMEIKGTIYLGSAGVLGNTDSFLRIKFANGDDNWKEIGRKSIKNGRLFIETLGDVKLFTISRISASQYNAVIEPGIHPQS